MKLTGIPQDFATLRNPISMLSMYSKRSAVRGCFVALTLSVCGTGCQQMRSPNSYPPPPGMLSSDLPPTSEQYANKNTALKANQVIAARPADDQPFIVRGQDSGGFVMPPLPEVTADGGRHNRDPMPVSGQRAVVAQTQVYGELPVPNSTAPKAAATTNTAPQTAPATSYPYSPSNPPSVNAPYVVPNMSPQSVPYSASQPGYGMQPGYDTLPQISTEDISLDPAQTVGIPYEPTTKIADIIVNGYPARTGRIMFGGAVNSDAGVTGQITLEERNFDITRFPTSFQDLIGGTAFRGAGQTLRIEAVPGNQFKRYSVNFSEPFLFGFMPISMNVSAFLFDRRYQDWDEERMGGRLNFGYRITPDLSISAGVRGEQVDVRRPRILGIPQLDAVLGENDIYSSQARLTHDTRNSPFAPSEGHYMEFTYEQAFGDFDFPRFEASFNKYFLVRERADGSGRQTFTTGLNVGISGEDTPIFENYFAGGYTTLRGFEFRGASPTVQGVQVGGRFQLLGTFEYMFPLTADDMLRAVAFVDYGTVEQDIELNRQNFRVAPGFGLRIAVPALGPAPLAFDFAFPVMDAAGDEQQTFSFYMGLTRRM